MPSIQRTDCRPNGYLRERQREAQGRHAQRRGLLWPGRYELVVERWRRHDNTSRPKSSLGCRPPAPEVVRVAGFAARSHFAGQPYRRGQTGSGPTGHAPRLKPGHPIGASLGMRIGCRSFVSVMTAAEVLKKTSRHRMLSRSPRRIPVSTAQMMHVAGQSVRLVRAAPIGKSSSLCSRRRSRPFWTSRFPGLGRRVCGQRILRPLKRNLEDPPAQAANAHNGWPLAADLRLPLAVPIPGGRHDAILF